MFGKPDTAMPEVRLALRATTPSWSSRPPAPVTRIGTTKSLERKPVP